MEHTDTLHCATPTLSVDIHVPQGKVTTGDAKKDKDDLEERRESILAAAYRCILPRKRSQQTSPL